MLASAGISNCSSIASQRRGPRLSLLWSGLLSGGKSKNFHAHFDKLVIHRLKILTTDNTAKQNTSTDVNSPNMEVECNPYKKHHW